MDVARYVCWGLVVVTLAGGVGSKEYFGCQRRKEVGRYFGELKEGLINVVRESSGKNEVVRDVVHNNISCLERDVLDKLFGK